MKTLVIHAPERTDVDEVGELRTELQSLRYSISHDLLAPVRAVAGFSRVFEEDYGTLVDDEGRRLLAIISGEAARLGSMTEDLLALSRLGSAPMEDVTIDMNTLVREVIAELALPSDLVSVQPALPQTNGDRAMLRRVWSELLANARTATLGRAGARVEIGAEREAGRAIYRVGDNGMGFNLTGTSTLFCMFQKLHPAGLFPGNGSGLAIVARIMRRHGGSVWADAHVEEGATFSFALPLRGAA